MLSFHYFILELFFRQLTLKSFLFFFFQLQFQLILIYLSFDIFILKKMISLGYLLPSLVIGLIFWPFIDQMIYWMRAKRRGLTIPDVQWSFPLGIPQFVQIIQSVRGHYMNKRNLEIAQKAPNRLTVQTQLLGTFVIMTTDPQNLKAMLATQFKDFGHAKRKDFFQPLFGDGIFTLDGAGWQHSRAMLRPQFTREQISHVNIIEDHLQKIIAKYKAHEKRQRSAATTGGNKSKEQTHQGHINNKYLDIQPLFFQLTLDTATQFLFGESVDLLSGGNPRIKKAVDFGEAFNSAQEVLTRRSVAQSFYWAIDSTEFREWCKTCKDFTSSYVQLALQRTEKVYQEKQHNEKEKESSSDGKSQQQQQPYVFLEELAKETRDPIVLRDQAINILVAGRDTTASLLSWTFLMLGRHKDVFKKLRTVIIKEFGKGDTKRDVSRITFETLKRCEYLRYVINETLRLYPTVPNNFRYALCDTSLPHGGGKDYQSPIFIPKGQIVMYSMYLTHRNPDIWGPDAHEFRPERWADFKQGAHTWDYLPFNGGPRICIGQQFALTEASYTIVRLLQAFKDIELTESALVGEPKELSTLTLSVAEGVPLKFVSS